MTDHTSKEVRMKQRPTGVPSAGDFETVTTKIPSPGKGQVLVRNLWMSVDPYMRLVMAGAYGEVAPGSIMSGDALGQVVESQSPDFKEGDYVHSMLGWREYALDDASAFNKIVPDAGPLEAYIGTLGMPGQTAYFGLLKAAELKDGERVFVSAASGAVGQVVCQIAKAHGCYVVGTAGSDEKCEWLEKEAGIDKAINYKTCGKLSKAIAEAFPEGIDVHFCNVAGEHLEAAITNIRENGRIAMCGAVDTYNSDKPVPGPSNLMMLSGTMARIQGFQVYAYMDQFPEFYVEMGKLIKANKMKWQQTVVEGIDNAPDALIGLFSGKNTGKMLVKLG